MVSTAFDLLKASNRPVGCAVRAKYRSSGPLGLGRKNAAPAADGQDRELHEMIGDLTEARVFKKARFGSSPGLSGKR